MPRARVAGLAWPEFQLRQAQRAGAQHIVVVAGRVSRDLVEGVDRLRKEAVSVSLIRTAAEAADLFHPDEAVLLLSGAAVVDPGQLEALLDANGTTILCLRGADADPHYELIDARDRWVGIARLQGLQVRVTADEVGEWDFASMLLRAAVRGKAQRRVLEDNDRLIDVGQPGAASAAAVAMLDTVASAAKGWGNRFVIDPAARLIARLGINALPVAARFAPWLATALFVAAPGGARVGGMAAGCALFLLALIVLRLGRIAAGVTNYPARLDRVQTALEPISAVLVLGIGTWPVDTDLTQLLAACVLIALAALSDRLKPLGDLPLWIADVPGYALILLVAGVFGPVGLTIGLVATVVHGFASLAWLQNRLSSTLTR